MISWRTTFLLRIHQRNLRQVFSITKICVICLIHVTFVEQLLETKFFLGAASLGIIRCFGSILYCTRILQLNDTIMFNIVLLLSQSTLPVHTVIVIWSESYFHQFASCILLIYHVNSLHDCHISVCRLILINFMILTQSTIIHFITSLFKLL